MYTNQSSEEANEAGALVSIGMPVRNGAKTIERAIRSVLAQDHANIEVVISDNASTDETETICRDLASGDRRIVYRRQSVNIGLLPNFMHTMQVASGTYFRWLGDDDWLSPSYISRCLEVLAEDRRLILVTTQIQYLRPDASEFTVPYAGTSFSSDDPISRFECLISFLIDGLLPVDPLYGLSRRDVLASIQRRNTIREDEVFAMKLALSGPWGHVPEVLAGRHVRQGRLSAVARTLGVPAWQAWVPTIVQCLEISRALRSESISRTQRRRARAAIGRLFLYGHVNTLRHRAAKLGNVIFRK